MESTHKSPGDHPNYEEWCALAAELQREMPPTRQRYRKIAPTNVCCLNK